MPDVQILHGPGLLAQKPDKRNRKAPATWNYGVRLKPDIATAVDNAARAANAKPVDIIRTAIVRFLALSETATSPIPPLTDIQPTPTISAPRTAPAYKGSGGSNYASIRKLPTASDRLRNRNSPTDSLGKLSDHTPVR